MIIDLYQTLSCTIEVDKITILPSHMISLVTSSTGVTQRKRQWIRPIGGSTDDT